MKKDKILESVSREDLLLKMQSYVNLRGKTVRSARRYLRSIGLNINYKGEIIFR